MTNFYGGQPGKSFDISWVFNSRFGAGNTIEEDINKGWSSPISVGSFVVISYGLPSNIDEYNANLEKDVGPNGDGKHYNSTLWKKIYDEESGTKNGLTYQLLMSMSGNTPEIEFKDTIVLDADQLPDVFVDRSKVDKPEITFKLPQSQVLGLKRKEDDEGLSQDGLEVLDANQPPEVTFDPSDINRPVLVFHLPRSQVITRAIVEEILKANEEPEVTLDTTQDGTINNPVLKFKLPISQQLLEKNISHIVLDANEKPYIEFDATTDVDNPSLVFYLPQSQVMDEPETQTVDPLVKPNVTDIGTVNNPKFRFDLPRAVQFYYGYLLGERTAGQYQITDASFADYGVGDYYINAPTGFVYRVSDKNENTCTFDYIACIQSPLPEIEAIGKSPYTEDLELAAPEVTRAFLNNEGTAWKLTFKLPNAPKPAVSATFIGPEEEGTANVEITDKDTATFNFEIPTGSKIFAGLEVDAGKFDAVVTGARPGDIYLNSETGKTYKLNKQNIWEVNEGSLKGPVGDALNIVREYRINETDTIKDSLQNGVNYILDNYKDSEGNAIPLSPDEIFAITWINTADNRETSYWYYYTEDGRWGRAQLTGGIMNLIETVYNPETDGPVDNKTYSISYINKLIGGKLDLDNLDKTAFSKDQIFDMLSWGTWADAIAGDDIPEPENHDTLSAEEVIELMSWGSISKLQVENLP